jgi:UDP-N-acetylglucosamine 4,6-dehydratase
METPSNILITGGTGTLGHAILRASQLCGWSSQFTVFSRSELAQARMRSRFPQVRFILGDVRDVDRVKSAVAGHDLVIHGAAMKRLPECEKFPDECFKTNVLGTHNVIRASSSVGARCIVISSDKACRATTVYGASKLLSEGLVSSFGRDGVDVVGVRYGNVLSSNGSALVLWSQQFARGEPLSVTNLRMTRFWMSPSQAVASIFRALDVCHPGEIFVPALSSLSISDLIEILFPGASTFVIGLRSREKLHEDLISSDEAVVELPDGYLLSSRGTTGKSYSSNTCPRIPREQFLSLVEDARLLESMMYVS